MARVSLILPISHRGPLPAERVHELRTRLEALGHSVDVVGVADPRSPALPNVAGTWWTALVADDSGLAVAAVAGLGEARGDVVVVLDHEQGYAPEDLDRVIAPVVLGDADLVIATRRGGEAGEDGRRGRLGAWAGAVARRLIGTTDPFSGLVVVSRSLALETGFAPIGSLFALELLARTTGRRVDVAASRSRVVRRGFALDDLRHVKRLADFRFGNLSRLFQFCAVGASGMVVDLSAYALFQWVFSWTWLATATAPVIGGPLALAAAGALAIALALCWNFSLNRRLTFSYARQGSLVRQFLAYVLSNALGIALSFSLRLLLPAHVGFFYRHRLAAAVVGIVAATGISFSMSRWVVFRGKAGAVDPTHLVTAANQADASPGERGPDGAAPHVLSRSRSASVCEPS